MISEPLITTDAILSETNALNNKNHKKAIIKELWNFNI